VLRTASLKNALLPLLLAPLSTALSLLPLLLLLVMSCVAVSATVNGSYLHIQGNNQPGIWQTFSVM
jgi:hypothetical protein